MITKRAYEIHQAIENAICGDNPDLEERISQTMWVKKSGVDSKLNEFRAKLSQAVDLSIGEYRKTCEQILEWFDESFEAKPTEAKE